VILASDKIMNLQALSRTYKRVKNLLCEYPFFSWECKTKSFYIPDKIYFQLLKPLTSFFNLDNFLTLNLLKNNCFFQKRTAKIRTSTLPNKSFLPLFQQKYVKENLSRSTLLPSPQPLHSKSGRKDTDHSITTQIISTPFCQKLVKENYHSRYPTE
jgi:hypothetical protein